MRLCHRVSRCRGCVIPWQPLQTRLHNLPSRAHDSGPIQWARGGGGARPPRLVFQKIAQHSHPKPMEYNTYLHFYLRSLSGLSSIQASALQTVERGLDVSTRLFLLVVFQCFHVRGFANDFLDFITSTRLLDVTRKSPLAYTPVFDRALPPTSIAIHLRRAPVRLTCHGAEVAPSIG